MTENLIDFVGIEDAPILGTVSATLPPLLCFASDNSANAVFATLPPLLVSGSGITEDRGTVAAVLPSLMARTGDAVSDVVFAELPPLKMFASDAAVTLMLNIGYAVLPPLLVSARGRVNDKGQASISLPPLLVRGGDAVSDAVFAELPPLIISSYDPFPPAVRYITAIQSPGVMLMTLGGATNLQTVSDGLTMHLQDNSQPVNALFERVGFDDRSAVSLESILRLTEGVTFGDLVVVVLQVLLQDAVTLDDMQVPTAESIAALQEALRLVEGPYAIAEVQRLIAEAVALNEIPSPAYGEVLSEDLSVGDAVDQRVSSILRMLDTLILDDTPANTALVGVVVADTFVVEDVVDWKLEVIERLQENLEFSITIRLGDTVYLAWVVNTENKAFSTYENYPFNSYTLFNGQYYGMADDGLYRLEGETDDGEAISARVRTGLNNMGTGHLKRYPSMYLAYTSDGQLLLKAIIVESEGEHEGEKVEYWYRLTPRAANVVREGRFKLGRGLKSVFAAWEIENVDGADFSISDLELFPMILERRIT